MLSSFKIGSLLLGIAALSSEVVAHYRFPRLIANGVTTADYQYVRLNTNYNSPVTSVSVNDFRCGVGAAPAAAIDPVTAGSLVGFSGDGISHPGVLNVYLGKVPSGSTAATWDGSGANWFKVYQISAVTDGGNTIKWPTDGLKDFTFKLPSATPNGDYLLRVEHIALHTAGSFGGAQYYISCGQIKVSGGGSGNPSKVSIPGVYTGNEPGILINIYYPIPATYTQPGPAVWTG